MGNHSFNVIVILFWLAMMSWLVVAKILPPLRLGEPPNYATILEHTGNEAPVSWSIRLQDRTIGWAGNRVVRRADGITELHSRVFLASLPLDALAPGWLSGLLKPALADVNGMELDKESCFSLDPLGRLAEFDSRLRLGDVADAVRVHGQVEGSTLRLSVRAGGITSHLSHPLPASGLFGDELSPQSRLPGLRVGQAWTVPLYSPFRANTSPVEILQAVVEREDQIHWDGQLVSTRMIAYRGDAGAGLAADTPRGRTWVRNDGLVLRQEVDLFRAAVQFERLGERQQALVADAWTGQEPLNAAAARRVLARLRGYHALEVLPAATAAGDGR